jgi:hypothetical protein
MTNQSDMLLRFQKGSNAKLGKDVWSFSLPAGWSCPGAKECMTKADPETGKITDGVLQQFRCFAATMEAARTSVRKSRWHNYELLVEARTREKIRDLIISSFPRKVGTMRIHVSGDFFSEAYFQGWCDAARHFSATDFYAYTKSMAQIRGTLLSSGLPKNLNITFSEGGRWDKYIDEVRTLAEETHNVSTGVASVVFHPEEAEKANLPIDHDDSHAMAGDHRFALLLHAQQPSNSPAAEAIKRMKREKVEFAYPTINPKKS